MTDKTITTYTSKISDAARELADNIGVFSAEKIASKKRWRPWEDIAQDIDDASIPLIQAFEASVRAEVLENCAEVCDNRDEHGDVFAAQIRALKSQTLKQENS